MSCYSKLLPPPIKPVLWRETSSPRDQTELHSIFPTQNAFMGEWESVRCSSDGGLEAAGMSLSVIWRNEGSMVTVPGTGDLSGSSPAFRGASTAGGFSCHFCFATLTLCSGHIQLWSHMLSPGPCPGCSLCSVHPADQIPNPSQLPSSR